MPPQTEPNPSPAPAPVQPGASLTLDNDFMARGQAAIDLDQGIAPADPDPAPEPEPRPAKPPAGTPPPDPEPKATDPEPAPSEDDRPPEGLTGKAAESFVALRKSHKSALAKLNDQIKAMETELAGVRGKKPEAPPDYEAIKREHEDMSKRLMVLDVEKHPRFEAYFNGKTKEVTDTLTLALGKDMAERATGLIQMPESPTKRTMLQEFIGELDELQRDDFLAANRSFRSIQLERQSEIQKARENLQGLRQQEERAAAEKQAALDKAFTAEIDNAVKNLPVFQKREGQEEWNRGVDQALSEARRIFGGDLEPQEIGRAAIWAAAAPRLLQSYQALTTELEAVKAELKAIGEAQPNPGKGAPVDHNAGPPADAGPQKGESYEQYVRRTAGNLFQR